MPDSVCCTQNGNLIRLFLEAIKQLDFSKMRSKLTGLPISIQSAEINPPTGYGIYISFSWESSRPILDGEVELFHC